MRYRGFPNPIAPVMSCLVNISVNDSTYLEERCDLGNEFVSYTLVCLFSGTVSAVLISLESRCYRVVNIYNPPPIILAG